MKLRTGLLTLLLSLLLAPVGATTELQRIGEGAARYMGMIRIYDARFESDRMPDASRWFEQHACLTLDYRHTIERGIFAEAAGKILARQHQPEQTQAQAARLEQLHSAMVDVKEGDQYRFCYTSADDQSRLELNGDVRVRIPGRDFAEYYLGIWLGQNGLSATLRQQLLGCDNGNSAADLC